MRKKILNTSNQCWYNPARVERMLADCSVGWVERGSTIRMLTPDESRAAKLAYVPPTEWLNEPLPHKERPGLRFDPPTSGIPATRREGSLAWEAHLASVGWFSWFGQPVDMREKAMAMWLKKMEEDAAKAEQRAAIAA